MTVSYERYEKSILLFACATRVMDPMNCNDDPLLFAGKVLSECKSRAMEGIVRDIVAWVYGDVVKAGGGSGGSVSVI
jgi:hypothetical protein